MSPVIVAIEQINDMAVKVLFGGHVYKPLVDQLPAVYTDNPDNYGIDPNRADMGKLRTDRKPLPAMIPVYKGMRIYLTANKDKENDFVNGMEATVEAYSKGCLTVRTTTGIRLPVYRITEKYELLRENQENTEVVHVAFFPIRLGYASTIDKVQGSTLGHITIWLNSIRKAAGHVALSRVEYAWGCPTSA